MEIDKIVAKPESAISTSSAALNEPACADVVEDSLATAGPDSLPAAVLPEAQPAKRKASQLDHEDAKRASSSLETPPDDGHDHPLQQSPKSDVTTEDEATEQPHTPTPVVSATRSSSRVRNRAGASLLDDPPPLLFTPWDSGKRGKTRKSYCNQNDPCKACRDYQIETNPARTVACILRSEYVLRGVARPSTPRAAAKVDETPSDDHAEAEQAVNGVEQHVYTRLELPAGYSMDTDDDDVLREVDTVRKLVCGCGQLFDDEQQLGEHQRQHHQQPADDAKSSKKPAKIPAVKTAAKPVKKRGPPPQAKQPEPLATETAASDAETAESDTEPSDDDKERPAWHQPSPADAATKPDNTDESDPAAPAANPEDKHTCAHCSRDFAAKSSLSAHKRHCELRQRAKKLAERRKNRVRVAQTCVCGRKFDSRSSLGVHRRYCPEQQNAVASKPATKPASPASPEPEEDLLPYQCICGRNFKKPQSLGCHQHFCHEHKVAKAKGAREKLAQSKSRPSVQAAAVAPAKGKPPASSRCACGKTFVTPLKFSHHSRRCAVAQAAANLKVNKSLAASLQSKKALFIQVAKAVAKAESAAKANSPPSKKAKLSASKAADAKATAASTAGSPPTKKTSAAKPVAVSATSSSQTKKVKAPKRPNPSDADAESEPPKRLPKVPARFEPDFPKSYRKPPPPMVLMADQAEAPAPAPDRPTKLRKSNAGQPVDASPDAPVRPAKADDKEPKEPKAGLSSCPCGAAFDSKLAPTRMATHARSCAVWKALQAKRKEEDGDSSSSEDEQQPNGGAQSTDAASVARVCEICNKSYRATAPFGAARCWRCIQVLHESETAKTRSPWPSPAVESAASTAHAAAPSTAPGVQSPAATPPPWASSPAAMTSPSPDVVPFNPNFVVVRRLNQKRGGTTVPRPSTISELLQSGSVALGIAAVKVRAVDTEAEITDMAYVREGTPVYLTTAEDEREF
eukprot:TRINITY_DN1120_c0_g1_i2.p1 TRINITY_DN1120_c0_g1~~TRINITY_DN1120_c0_g1_i2.p1  ORF type:complete len:969 (-),score=295.18 TRINITY_DN1120_c0_g1_i2:79-2985(-)